ncbi:NAD(P)H-hydrate epimerase / ADP-dependent (S)-NAD(P)H-hydrate dehydratase [hydrothermal vent metagenome]|uniref:Nicotinamide nucleotide repair protein n=1 Tax=hydrothermal vent metagenome TaxID=652676 RepID=A0A3B0VCR9_9ZZZZ
MLVDAKTMRALDRKTIKDYGIKGLVLMENAGRGLAEAVAELLDDELEASGRARVSIICGKGNNGGDGFVAARHLRNGGYEVEVFMTAPLSALKGDAAVNARIWEKMGGSCFNVSSAKEIEGSLSRLRHSAVVVDALFGTGLKSELKGLSRALVEVINSLSAVIVSVDIPSGLDATTGKVHGAAVMADLTVTMGYPKLGFFLYPGKDYTGEIDVVDIGMPPEVAADVNIDNYLIDDVLVSELLSSLLWRTEDTHKGNYGHLLVAGGSTGKSGAVVMAATSAMRVGAGLVSVAVPCSLHNIMEVKTTEVMTTPLSEEPSSLGRGSVMNGASVGEIAGELGGKSALIVGPGLGKVPEGFAGALKGLLACCAEEGVAVLIDADGLNALDGKLSILKHASDSGAEIVITPHPGEAATLLGKDTTDIQEDRLRSAGQLREKTGAVVVLKGASTIVATEEGVFINPTGNPGMATAGMGDVLAGIIGGLMAQGLAVVDASVAGVYLHGMAGDIAAEDKGEAGLVATDLIEEAGLLIKGFAESCLLSGNGCREDGL